MPRYPEDKHFEIIDDCTPDSDVMQKLDAAWAGLQRVEVYQFEKSSETGKKKEKILGHFFPCGSEDDEEVLPDDGEPPIESKDEVALWIYSIGVAFANEEDRPVECRGRLYSLRGGKTKTYYPQFTAFPEDAPEEIVSDEEDEPPKRPPFSLGAGRPGVSPGGPQHPLFGRLGMGLGAQNIRAKEERLETRERELEERAHQQVGDVVELLRDRFAIIDIREQRVMDVLVKENENLHRRNQELVDAQNKTNEALNGGRRAQHEAHREAMTAFSEGLRMQSAAGQHRIEVIEARADEKIKDIEQRAREESRRSLAQALLVPLVPQIPGLITSIAGIVAAVKSGSPIPPPAPAAPAPAPTTNSPTTGAGAPFPGAAGNPVATGQPWAGVFLIGNEVAASFSEEQKTRMRSDLGDVAYNSFMAWMNSTSDEACIGNMVAFQQAGGSDAYEKLEAICDKRQDELVAKMATQIAGGMQASAAQQGITIDTTAVSR